MEKLLVYPERMLANLRMTRGLIYSQFVLLKLIEKGLSRERAYAVVQRNAMRSWHEGLDFKELLLADDEVTAHIDKDELDQVFREENFLRNVDVIFERVFGGEDYLTAKDSFSE
jgi:adenylosuccinate lyase